MPCMHYKRTHTHAHTRLTTQKNACTPCMQYIHACMHDIHSTTTHTLTLHTCMHACIHTLQGIRAYKTNIHTLALHLYMGTYMHTYTYITCACRHDCTHTYIIHLHTDTHHRHTLASSSWKLKIHTYMNTCMHAYTHTLHAYMACIQTSTYSPYMNKNIRMHT